MQKKVVDWLYNLQSRWGILKEEERSLYEYAYRLLLSRILIYSIIIALGIITGNWLEMFSFLLPFVILRQYVGGIHLKRSVSCICVSGFLIFICGKYLAINSELGITFCIVWLIAIAVIFLLCPVDTGHKRLDAKKILAQTILFYMNKKGVLLKDIPCTLNQILKCLSVNTDNNDIIYRWIELLKKYNYVTETDGIYVCKIEIYEKGLKYGWEEVEYLWKGKLESPLVLDYIINNIKNWDKLIQKEQQATLLLFEQGEDIYAHALYKETKILQYLNHSLSKKVLGYLHENANATILEIGAGTGATSNKVLSDIRENKFEEHIVYFYTDISRFFLQRAKERYKECDGKIEMHHQTLDIDEAFSSQLPSNFQADIVIAVGVLNNSVNTDKCIYEINSVMKPGGILLVIETVEDVPDILITQSFMMTAPKDRRKATNTMFLNRKQWLEILEENGFCNSEEFPGYGEYLEVLGQKLFYCTKE